MKQTTEGKHPAEDRFPSQIYRETVLAVNFEDARDHFLGHLFDLHYAHCLMLARQGIIQRDQARALINALDSIDRKAIACATYEGDCEDLFFYIEQRLAAECGEELAGKLHIARSRNDIDIALYRMEIRRRLLGLIAETLELRALLIALARRQTETIMPAHTHTQPAQPTTLAHYLMGAVAFLGRDAGRMQAAFSNVNRSPLGACAITTTGFLIDRSYTAQLLGFEDVEVNSYGAIASVDYVLESAASVAVLAVDLGKLVQDVLLWCMQEFGYLRLSGAYVQTSSIMPQKRNPVAIEHARILASRALGEAQAVFTAAHNTPFGDIVDSEDDLQPLVFTMFNDAVRALRLFRGALENANFDVERMAGLARSRFLTVTELADTLVRDEGIDFRQAHRLVGEAVKSSESSAHEHIVDRVSSLAPRVIGRELAVSRKEMLQALDPVHFVRIRDRIGGPAPVAVHAALGRAGEEQAGLCDWLDQKLALLHAYPGSIEDEKRRLAQEERD